MSEIEAGLDVVDGDGELKHPSLTTRWLQTALSAGRTAFEREMKRERRSLDAEFDRFWKERSARQA